MQRNLAERSPTKVICFAQIIEIQTLVCHPLVLTKKCEDSACFKLTASWKRMVWQMVFFLYNHRMGEVFVSGNFKL